VECDGRSDNGDSKRRQGAFAERCVYDMIWFFLMYPPFLTSMLIFWKGYQEHHQLSERCFTFPELYYTVFILATLTPVTEEHTKLIDHLSEPSSQLIHHISHLSEEEH